MSITLSAKRIARIVSSNGANGSSEKSHAKQRNGSTAHPETANAVWQFGLLFLTFSLIFVALTPTQADPDLWGHLRFGLDLFRTGAIAQIDPYSYLTAGHRWINHEWLAEALFALTWLLGGAAALVALKVTVGLLTFGLVYSGTRHQRHGLVSAALLLATLLVTFWPGLSTVRPHMFTFLLFALTLLLVQRAERGDYRWLWAAPAVVVLWVNLHGGVLAGLGVLLVWGIVHAAANRGSWTRIAPPLLLTFTASCVNPYGPTLPLFLLETATVPRPEIVEWSPLVLGSALGLFYLMLLTLAVTGLIFSRRPRSPALTIVFAVVALVPFTGERHLPLFALTALLCCGDHMADVWNRNFRRYRFGSRLAWAAPVAVLPALIGLAFLVPGTAQFGRIGVTDGSYPAGAVDVLERSGIEANLAVDFSWGEYVIWHVGPTVKVSIDGRRETAYTADVYRENLDLMFGLGEWDRLIERPETDLALIGKSYPAYNLMAMRPDWVPVYEDAASALFARKGSALIEPLRLAAQDRAGPVDPYFP